jgi:predicted RNase H-like HicB family nuclease
MNVTVRIHLEQTEVGATWWAEVPEVPGFSALGTSLDELMARSRVALTEIAAERWPTARLHMRFELVPVSDSDNPVRARVDAERTTVREGSTATDVVLVGAR